MNLLSNTVGKALPSSHSLGKAFVCLSILFCLVSLQPEQAYADTVSRQTRPLSAPIAEDFIHKADSGSYQASIHSLQIETLEKPVHMDVEVVATDESRARGLMYRFDLPENYGMLFVFPDSHQRCFWMKNTYIPLSIAYIDAQGSIVSIHDMQAHDLSSVCSSAPAMFALEVKQGWFTQHQITVGNTIRIKQH